MRTTPRHYRADEGLEEGRVLRIDRRTGLGRPQRTDEGYLLLEGYIAKPGVMTYRNPDGSTRRELIPAEELHRADSLATINRKPVTLNHPPPAQRPVGPHNVRRLGVGDAAAPEVMEDGHVKMSLMVRDGGAIKAIEGGKQELSPGYSVRLDETPGVHPEFGPYDAIQRDRRYDHLAIVSRARGGHTVRLRADEAASDDFDTTSHKEPQMNKILLMLAAGLGLSMRADDSDESAGNAIQGAIGDLKAKAARADAAEAAQAAEKTRADEAEKALETEKAQRADAEGKVLDLPALVAWSRERASLEKAAREHKIDGLDNLDTMEGAEIRKAVVLKVNADADADGSEDYYRAAFDLLPTTKGEAGKGGKRADSVGGLKGPDSPGNGRASRADRSRHVDGTKGYNDAFEAQKATHSKA